MDWGEVDTVAATWTVPAPRMKARREHRVPLPRRAMAVLEEARSLGSGNTGSSSRRGRESPSATWPSPCSSGGSKRAMPFLTASGRPSRTGRWNRRPSPGPWWKRRLAHTLGSATESAYARSDLFDRRRDLMETWAKHCERGGSLPAAAAFPGALPAEASAPATKHPLGRRVLEAFRAASGTAGRD